MKDYGLTMAMEIPKEIDIKETKVFVSTDIEQITVETEEDTHTEYQFNLIEYEKDEYIQMMVEKEKDLERQITDTQLALCDVYEMLGE